MNYGRKQHKGSFIRIIGGWGKYYSFLKNHNKMRNKPCPCGSGKKYKKCCLI